MSKNIQECLMTYYKAKGMNCAETTLLAANEAWNELNNHNNLKDAP